jgi:uncharacterized protein YidB (DUF937 family)
MNISELASNLLSEKLGVSLDSAQIESALSGLLGDGQGGIDLAGLASKMGQNGDLGALLGSWLGDGANESISGDSVSNLLGQDGIAKFANQLGVDPTAATQGLADMLPQVMDKASSGGSLLDSVGGIDGLLGAAKSLFR